MIKQETIHSLFEAQVAQNPNHIALILEKKSFTYEKINKKANQLAHYLHKMGVIPDTTVALCMERSVELLIVMLAILKAGGAYLPLDPSHPEERLLFLLNDSNTNFLITQSPFQEKFKKYTKELIIFEQITGELDKKTPKILGWQQMDNN